MTLDPVQTRALHAFTTGKPLAILGGAGCGKSFLLQAILECARNNFGGYPVVTACAPSNQVADKIRGRSIHATFGGFPHWPWSKTGLWNIIAEKPAKLNGLRAMKILVIDEICLVTSVVLDAIDYVLRKVAPTEVEASIPFGGRQVVFSEDAFQLPEIEQAGNRVFESPSKVFPSSEGQRDGPVQSSRSWFLTFGGFGGGTVVLLDVNHRQAGDPGFYKILQRIRHGDVRIREIEEINRTSKGYTDPPSTHTQLCLYREEVDHININALSRIDDVLHTLEAEDCYTSRQDPYLLRRLEQAAPKFISVKVGCSVLLSVNIGGVNSGTHGIVEDIISRNVSSQISDLILSVEGKKVP